MKEAIRMVRDRYYRLSREDFNQWLLEFLTRDINDRERDSQRIEVLRFVANNGLV